MSKHWLAIAEDLRDRLMRCHDERHRLAETMKLVQPLLYGLLLERWGYPESWPKNAHGAQVYARVKEDVDRIHQQEEEANAVIVSFLDEIEVTLKELEKVAGDTVSVTALRDRVHSIMEEDDNAEGA